MARRNKQVPPYRSCQNKSFIIKENTFKIDEPRLKTSFGKVYDKALSLNPVSSTCWRDIFISAFVTALLSTVYTASNIQSLSWRVLKVYYITDIVLAIGSVVSYVKQSMARIKSESRLSVREEVIDEAFYEIVRISEGDLQE